MQSLHCGWHGGVSGDDNHVDLGVSILHLLKKLHPVNLQHQQIGENEIEGSLFQLAQGLGTICGSGHLVALFLQYVLQIDSSDFFVVHNKNAKIPLDFQSANRKVLKDSLFHQRETCVFSVEDVFNMMEIKVVLSMDIPWERHQVFQMVDADGVFSCFHRSFFELIQLFYRVTFGRRRHLRFEDFLPQQLKILKLLFFL